jgi:hypothetical protein
MSKRKDLVNNLSSTMLLLNCIQWNKDSHGLFDYDLREIRNSFFKVKTSKDVVRKENELVFKEPGIDVKEKLDQNH